MFKKLKDKQILIAIFGLVVIILLASYFIYTNMQQSKRLVGDTNIVPTEAPKDIIPTSPPVALINPNDKTVSGTIISSSKTAITIKLDDGTSQTYKLSSNAVIIPFPTPGKGAFVSHDMTKIKVGNQATLSLETQENAEVVATILYTK